MKRAALLTLFLTCLAAVSTAAVPTPSVVPMALSLVESSPVVPSSPEEMEPRTFLPVKIGASAAETFGYAASRMPMPNPNFCGDPCPVNGQTVGCIDTSGRVWRRVFCTCVAGTLLC